MDNDKLFSAYMKSSEIHNRTLEAMLVELDRHNNILELKKSIAGLITASLSAEIEINRELQGLPKDLRH